MIERIAGGEGTALVESCARTQGPQLNEKSTRPVTSFYMPFPIAVWRSLFQRSQNAIIELLCSNSLDR
jgi:hypothetical protein